MLINKLIKCIVITNNGTRTSYISGGEIFFKKKYLPSFRLICAMSKVALGIS